MQFYQILMDLQFAIMTVLGQYLCGNLQKLSNHFLKEHLQNKYFLWQLKLSEQVLWDCPVCGFSGVF